MEIINPLSAIPTVGHATSQGKGRGQGQTLPDLGQLLKALVVEAKGDNRFVLDIGGNRLTASSEAKLTVGQTLQLQVTKTEAPIELKIVAGADSLLAGKSLALLGKNIDLGALFAAMKGQSPPPLSLLTPISRATFEEFFSLQSKDFANQDGATLKRLIDNLGLNLEHLLARGDKEMATRTLKAALLEAVQVFASAEDLAETTQKLLTTLELFQIAQLQGSNTSQLIFPLPLPFIEQGYLVVDDHGQGGEDDTQSPSETRFALHLTMSDLGHLRIDFLRNPEGLFLRFFADSEDKAGFLAEHQADLKQAIGDIPLIGLSFAGGAVDPVQELLRKIIPQGRSLLDTTV